MTSVRIVSLVPSLTEAVALSAPGALAGATDWCTHPAGLDVARIGGTKNPKIPLITALAPDLVIANEEENRAPDLDALRAAGLEVLVTEVRTLPQAFDELARVLTACGVVTRPRWLGEAEAAWDAVTAPAARRTAVVPVWRRPWMVLGRDTFAGDLLSRLGVDHLYAENPERYPRVPWTSCARRPRTSSCCPTSRTASPPTTAWTPSPDCPAPWSAAGTSPGTGRRWPRRRRCCPGRCERWAADSTGRHKLA